jgi:hypothetical protein
MTRKKYLDGRELWYDTVGNVIENPNTPQAWLKKCRLVSMGNEIENPNIIEAS